MRIPLETIYVSRGIFHTCYVHSFCVIILS
nr:MAG TPA_asm: hypothetical protein [Caudoviricetes sp.]